MLPLLAPAPMADDFAGLVGESKTEAPMKRPSPTIGENKAKRTQLRRYDHFACQVNNHLGVSMIKDAGPCDVWPAMCNGNHMVAYFHEFASKDAAVRGVGWSKIGQLFEALEEPLKSNAMKTIVNPDVLTTCLRIYKYIFIVFCSFFWYQSWKFWGANVLHNNTNWT